MKCSISWDVRVTIVRCSGLERSRRGKMFYCNIRTPVHRIAIPKVMWLLYPKFWVQTFDIATLRTGVSVFCNLHTAFPLNFPVCVPRPRSGFYWHRSRFSSWSPGYLPSLEHCGPITMLWLVTPTLSCVPGDGAAAPGVDIYTVRGADPAIYLHYLHWLLHSLDRY